MKETTFMEKYLPVVKREIAGSLSANLQNQKDVRYLKQQIKEIEEVNPVVADWIRKFSKTTKDRKGSAFAAVILYKMLYSQCEADIMLLEEQLAEEKHQNP